MNLFRISVGVADLEQRIRRIYDHLYANGKRRTPAGISLEVGKVLHMAQYREEVEERAPAFDFTAAEIKQLIRGSGDLALRVAQAARRDFSAMIRSWGLYPPDAVIELSDPDVCYLAAQLSGVLVSDRERDVFGDAVEVFRSYWAKREGGMFFTDQRVTRLALALLRFDPRNGDDLVDISAGTGGFLSAGLNRIRALLEREEPGKDVESRVIEYAVTSLKGHEIDADVARVANATLVSRTGRIGHEFVRVGDSLAPAAFGSDYPFDLREGSHRCAASNPPFGTKTTIKDAETLRAYDLARSASRAGEAVSPRPPDILLLERNVRLLQPGVGRLAIVLPYQLLSGPQTAFVREWLLRHTSLEAVIDLPPETFQPHTGTKTALVVLRRRERPLAAVPAGAERRVFMALPRWIGHDRRGNPVFERAPDGSPTARVLSDFDRVEAAFEAFTRGDDPRRAYEQTFAVAEHEITADPLHRINALYHQPRAPGGGTAAPAWPTVRLREVVSRIFFPTRFKRNYIDRREGAVPFFGGSNITEFIAHTDKWLDPNDPKLEELRVRAGWLLVTRSGSTGIVSSVPPAWDGVAMSEHVIRIVPDPEKMPGEYLQAFLRTEPAQRALARSVFGSVIDEINPETIGGLEVPVPPAPADLDRVVRAVRTAEAARQTAINDLFATIDALNRSLTRAG